MTYERCELEKTETETGKTRPCIVYVKNLKEAETTELINFNKQSKIVRNVAVKISNKRTNADRECERRREREQDLRETRTTRRASSIATVELFSKRQTAAVVVGKTPTAAAAARGRIVKANILRSAVTGKQAAVAPQHQQQQVRSLNKRRNTELPVARATSCIPATLTKRRDTTRLIETESKSPKMYKQSKITTPTPPPTIAASRSRRSIKPNPKYASEDMVTPKYVSSLANESLNKRTGKQLFMDDDDEDEDMHDLIEEDNDDELNDAAFEPQMHKSDDDDDMSENEYEEEQQRREKVPPKRGRGRPPKNPQAIAAAAATQAARSAAATSTQYQTGRGISQSGRGGVTNLQQLRRTMAANANSARSI